MSGADHNRRTNKMRTVRIKVLKFEELDAMAKQKAIEWYMSGFNDDAEICRQDSREDAKQIGLKIISLDDHRANEGEFLISAAETAKLIFANHGEQCDTYKTALDFTKSIQEIEKKAEAENKDGDEEYYFSEEIEEAEKEFLQSLLEDYRIMLNKDIDYRSSEEYISEHMQANDYEFTEEGNYFYQLKKVKQ